MTTTIGFVGLGIMGLGMVKNLVTKLGVNLVVWNRGTTVCDEINNLYPGKVSYLYVVKPHTQSLA